MAMTRVEASVEVNAPVKEVFAYASDSNLHERASPMPQIMYLTGAFAMISVSSMTSTGFLGRMTASTKRWSSV